MHDPNCKRCHGKGSFPIPCPDNKEGCCVLHTQVCDCELRVEARKMTEVAVLQVAEPKLSTLRWQVVAVFGGATSQIRVHRAEQEASLRGYTRWSVSEFAVMGGDNA